jgi:hypothetical protein
MIIKRREGVWLPQTDTQRVMNRNINPSQRQHFFGDPEEDLSVMTKATVFIKYKAEFFTERVL